MVRRGGFAAINETERDDDGSTGVTGETVEAQEARLAATYEQALSELQAGNKQAAQALLEGLLLEPLVQAAEPGSEVVSSSALGQHLRFLVLKNLAGLLAEADETAEAGLQLYGEALSLDQGDVVLWKRMGILAAELGRLGLARAVLEAGLQRAPRHLLLQEGLAEVLLGLGDWEAAHALAAWILQHDPSHPRAAQIQQALRRRAADEVGSPLPAARAGDSVVRQRAVQPRVRQRYQPVAEQQPVAEGPVQLHLSRATWAELSTQVSNLLQDGGAESQAAAGRLVQICFLAPSATRPSMPGDAVNETEQARAAAEPAALTAKVFSETMAVDAASRKRARSPSPDRMAVGDAAAAPAAASGMPHSSSAAQHDSESASHTAAKLHKPDEEFPGQAARKSPPCEPAGAAAKDGGSSAGARPREDKSQLAPSRVSKRLERRRGEASEEEGEGSQQEERNVLGMLGPFLPPRASLEALAPEVPASTSPTSQPGESTQQEAAAVRDFAAKHAPMQLLPLAAALVAELTCDAARLLSREACQALLALENLVKGWPWSAASACFLAELQLDAALRQARPCPRGDEPASVRAKSAPAGGPAGGLEGPARRKAHLQAVETNLGLAQMAMLHDDRPEAVHPAALGAAPQQQQLVLAVRYHWASGRLAEAQRHPEEATSHLRACQELCRQHGLSVRLANCEADALIDETTAAGRLEALQLYDLLAEGAAMIQGGQAQALLDRLRVVLLPGNGPMAPGQVGKSPDHISGLQLMQEAAAALGAAGLGTVLQSQLLLLQALLPREREPADLASHAASPSGPPPAAVAILQKQPRKALLSALESLSAFVERNVTDQARPVLQAAADGSLDLLRPLQWQLLSYVERAFWSAGQQASLLNKLETAKRDALLRSVLAFCSLHELTSLASPDASESLELLSAAFRLLADRNTLTTRNGVFLRHCVSQLAACMSHPAKMPAGGNSPAAASGSDAELVEVSETAAGALAQCLYILYGVDLPQRDPDWAGGCQETSSGRITLESPEECLEVWRCLLPYAITIQGRRRDLARLQGILDAMHAGFPAPPAEVVSSLSVDSFLDAEDVDEAALLRGEPPAYFDLVARAHDSSSKEGAWQVYNNLYFMLAVLQAEPDSVLPADSSLVQPAQAEAMHARLEEYASLAKYDLCYNPQRFFSWDKLAGLYREAADTLLTVAAYALSCERWHTMPALHVRVRMYERRALRATLVARQLAASWQQTNDLAFHEEQLGGQQYEGLQDVPPVYDQRQHRPARDETYASRAQAALASFQWAAALLPEEWQFQQFMGKLAIKLCRPASEALRHFALACHYAAKFAGGLLEPVYRLHATRLKMLLDRSCAPAELARYCFSDELASQVAVAEQDPAQLYDLLYADCCEALQFCAEKKHNFHKASYRLACALERDGRPAAAVEQLRQLFSNNRRAFCINMWAIGISTSAGGRKGKRSRTPTGAGSEPGEEGWGRKPAQISGPGLVEHKRKFLACLRKYVPLYLALLARSRDLDTLHAAAAFLLSGKEWTHAPMADIARLAIGQYVVQVVTGIQELLVVHSTHHLGGHPPAPPIGVQSSPATATLAANPGAGSASRAPTAAPPVPATSAAGAAGHGLMQLAQAMHDAAHLPALPPQPLPAPVLAPQPLPGPVLAPQTLPGPVLAPELLPGPATTSLASLVPNAMSLASHNPVQHMVPNAMSLASHNPVRQSSSAEVGGMGTSAMSLASHNPVQQSSLAAVGASPRHHAAAAVAPPAAAAQPSDYIATLASCQGAAGLFERAYQLHAEYCMLGEGESSWEATVWPGVLQVLSPTDARLQAISEKALQQYSLAHILQVEGAADWDKLQSMYAAIRKRFKTTRLAPQPVRAIISALAASGTRLMAMTAGALEQQASSHGVTHADAASPHHGHLLSQHKPNAHGESLHRADDANIGVPQRTDHEQPAAAQEEGQPGPQPLPPSLDNEQLQQAYARLKACHSFHKIHAHTSGQGADQPSTGDLLLRCYCAYLKLCGIAPPEHPQLTVAQAASNCEELAKAAKRQPSVSPALPPVINTGTTPLKAASMLSQGEGAPVARRLSTQSLALEPIPESTNDHAVATSGT